MDQLSAREHPVAESEKEEGGFGQVRKDGVVKLFVVGWRNLVNVVDHVVFKAVKDQKRHSCDREQNWNTGAEHHGNENNVHDTRVSEMEEIHRTSISVDVLLDRDLLGSLTFCGTHLV